MPGSISGPQRTADLQTSHQFGRRAHDASGPVLTPSPASNPTRMAPLNKTPQDSLPDECLVDTNHKSGSRTPTTSRLNRTNSRNRDDAPLASDNAANSIPPRPVEASIWDWDTPLDSVGESSSYFYEPQGELLQEQRSGPKGDFSIPTAVPNSGITWPFASNGKTDVQDFAVPRRPTASTPSTLLGVKRKSTSDQLSAVSKPPDRRSTRAMSAMSDSGEEATSPGDPRPPSVPKDKSHSGPSTVGRGSTAEGTPRSEGAPVRPSLAGAGFGSSTSFGGQRRMTDPGVPLILPARKVFPIQIGDKLFRLSGASISSDAPSYFSQFFEEQLRQNEGADGVRTLYIDRDPGTFEDIALHLQGYHVEPRDGPHFVKLFADAQFYSLPRLTQQLFSSTIYIRIGGQEFQIPRDLFSNPGDSPNYFSLGFSMFFTTPSDVFPGLSQRSLLRPPTILPPSVPNRSAKIFGDLMHVLKGYPVEIRSEEHRAELLRDARYFHLKGLEQRLIPHEISYNLAWKRSEISIRLEDIRQSGVSFVPNNAIIPNPLDVPSPASSTTSTTSPASGPGWVYYQRPYVDSEAYSLILEIQGEENTTLAVETSRSTTMRMARATFYKQTLSRITSLFTIIANKMNLPVTQPLGLMMMERGAGVASLPVSPRNTGVSDEKVKCRIGADADVTVDGKPWFVSTESDSGSERRSKRRKRAEEQEGEEEEDDDEEEEWIVRKSQWRLRVQPVAATQPQQPGRTGMEVVLGAVKIEAFRSERGKNSTRGFLA